METVADLAIEARNTFGLRHVPLLLLMNLIQRGGSGVAETINSVIRRADEMTELLHLYKTMNGNDKPLAKQLKKGLALAFTKFSEYQLAKYDRDGPVRLRDVMFLTHPKPKDKEQEELFKRVADKNLAVPDTWEVQLSAGANKKETFERLIRQNKLGYLALLRNVRNMMNAGCDVDLVSEAILARKGAELVFPFRYVAAARACPQLEPVIDQALIESIQDAQHFPGRTIILVDVSGSMSWNLSVKSDMNRMDAACTLASIMNGSIRVFSFSNSVVEVPHRKGMAGVDAIQRSQRHSGTDLRSAVLYANSLPHDRLIVITDEQSRTPVPDPLVKKAYMINVASNRNGVGYGSWVHIDGFSESVIRYIQEMERQ